MANKDIIIYLPNANLRKKAQKVGIITDEIKQLIQDMKDATLDWEASRKYEVGVALAAGQVDKHYRIIIIRNDFDNKDDHSFRVFINARITKLEGDITEDYEGCLSIQEIYGKVPRYSKVQVRAMGEDGREFRIKAEGFLARVFQHEIDHTNGTVFIDHIKDKPQAFYRLGDDGKLTKLNYEKDIKKNSLLW